MEMYHYLQCYRYHVNVYVHIFFTCVYCVYIEETYSINSARVHAGCVALTHEARFLCARGGGHRMRFSPGDIWYRTIFVGGIFFWGHLCVTEREEGREESRGRGLSLSPPNPLSGVRVFFPFFLKCVLPNVSDGLRVHAILFSQCSAARAHELGILRALCVNFLRLHHHITERKHHLKYVSVEYFFSPIPNVFLHHASTLTAMGISIYA